MDELRHLLYRIKNFIFGDYRHDLLLSLPAASEQERGNNSENKICLSVEIAKVPEGTDEDGFLDWVEEMEEMER